jgi:F420-non-reducing hydrogenase iron-sulfur subunit
MRLSYPANVKIIKVPCTGRVDVTYILKGFEEGLDGIFLVGCLDGDCHFQAGNVRAKKRVAYAKSLLDESGVGGERIAMFQVSSAEGHRFADAAKEMTERIRALGPNPACLQKTRGQGVEDSSVLMGPTNPRTGPLPAGGHDDRC